jgi:hypothetical protein
MSTTAICGCELLDANGRAAVNPAKAIAFETGLIQERGFESLAEVDRILDPMIPVRPANPNEGEEPRDFIEYRFGLGNSNIEASDDPFASGTVSKAVTIDTPNGPQNLTVNQKSSGSLMCDNRGVTMLAGQDVRRGTYKVLPDIDGPCICVWDFARVSEFGAYLRALRTAMPQESATMKERQLLRDLIALSKYNVSESGASEPTFTEGYFPYRPVGGANLSTFRKLRDRLKRQGHPGMIEVPISGPSLQNMMVHHYQLMNIQHQVANWTSGAFPSSWTDSGSWVFEDIKFVHKATPILGIFVQTEADRFDFQPISPRKWRAGTAAGVVYDYNEDYDKPVIVLNGAAHEVFELIPVISPRAFYQQPIRMNPLGVEGVSDDGTMWNGVTVRTIGGAFIPCNEKLSKFRWQLSNAYRLVPIRPYLSGFVAIRKSDYLRGDNMLGLNAAPTVAGPDLYYAGNGIQPNASSCADARAGLYPIDPAPGPMSNPCEGPSTSAGVFRTPCAAVVDENATSITLVVERINGGTGAASLAYATANDTAASGTDYTATSGTLSWAAGEVGPKTITVPILAGARQGYAFNVNFSGATGASIIASGCTTAAVSINRPAVTYTLASGLTGSLTAMVVNGGAFALPNAPYAATAAGAEALRDDITDLLNGDGYAAVVYNSGWRITVTDTHSVFTSATNGTTTKTFAAS